MGKRRETCREHATALTSQGASWLLGIAAWLPSRPYRPDFSGQGVSAIYYPAVPGSVCWRGNVVLPSRNTGDRAVMAMNERKGSLK